MPAIHTWDRRLVTCPLHATCIVTEPSHVNTHNAKLVPLTGKISCPNRSVQVTDHFTCISTNALSCLTCTLCKKIYIGETRRRLADCFHKHLLDVEKNNTDASKPVTRHFNLQNHSHHNMTICGHHRNTESHKISNKNSFFNWVHSLHTELMNASHSTNLFTNSCDHISKLLYTLI